MRCEKFTQDEREYFLTLIAMNRTVAEAREEFYKHYPQAEPYTHETLKRWRASKEGKAELAEVQSGIRSTARDESFANKDSRIMALVELAEKGMANLRLLDPVKDNKEYVALGRDFRDLLTKIAEEVDPFNLGDGEIMSSAQAFLKQVQEEDVPEWMLEKVFEKPQIQAS